MGKEEPRLWSRWEFVSLAIVPKSCICSSSLSRMGSLFRHIARMFGDISPAPGRSEAEFSRCRDQ